MHAEVYFAKVTRFFTRSFIPFILSLVMDNQHFYLWSCDHIDDIHFMLVCFP